VDDILLLGKRPTPKIQVISSLITLFTKATRMQINSTKLYILFHKVPKAHVEHSQTLLPYPSKAFNEGLKYLGFHLKPLSYRFTDWIWLYNKIEARISCWVNGLLSRGG